MIPVAQRICAAGVSEETRIPGDCVKCCVASVLELPYEDVPHFVAGEWLVAPRAVNGMVTGPAERVDWRSALDNWLRETGWALRTSSTTYHKDPLPRGPVKDTFDWYEPYDRPRIWSPGQGFWIASVISENFERSTHAVVMLDGEVVFDPSSLPRRTPYQFVGELHFVATDPSLFRKAKQI